jgi:hypothetical protein
MLIIYPRCHHRVGVLIRQQDQRLVELDIYVLAWLMCYLWLMSGA